MRGEPRTHERILTLFVFFPAVVRRVNCSPAECSKLITTPLSFKLEKCYNSTSVWKQIYASQQQRHLGKASFERFCGVRNVLSLDKAAVIPMHSVMWRVGIQTNCLQNPVKFISCDRQICSSLTWPVGRSIHKNSPTPLVVCVEVCVCVRASWLKGGHGNGSGLSQKGA